MLHGACMKCKINWCLKVFTKYTLSLRASAQDFRGNPPVEWNQVTITTKNRNISLLCRAIVETFSL